MSDELSPSERDAYEALPREREASRLLEERVVGALRREGLLRAPRAARVPVWSWRLMPAMAAGLLLFAGGVFVGTRLDGASPVPAGPMAAGDRATRIEQSGQRYLAELSALSRGVDTTRSDERTRGSQVASRILRQAAQEVARLDPNDPLADRIVGGGEMADAALASNEGTHIVWY